MAEVQSAAGRRKEMTMTVVFLGIDLTKNVFALHGVVRHWLMANSISRTICPGDF
jgi:hypothetical protein